MKTLLNLSYFLFAIVFLCASVLTACKNSTKETDAIKYQTIENNRFGYRVKVPAKWDIIDTSANGDGYYIITENKDTDLRIFAQFNVESIQDEYCRSTEDYSFSDSILGKLCIISDTEFYISRMNSNTQVTLYVNTTSDWLAANQKLIDEMAKSLALK